MAIETEPRYCLCADPENCIEAVPGRICKAGRNVADSYWSEEDERQSIECGAARPITKADAEAIEIALTQSDTAAEPKH